MPIYEYTCENCERDFEQLVRTASEASKVTCPECGGHKVARKLSVFAARQDSQSKAASIPAGGCGRCGDPNGPCAM